MMVRQVVGEFEMRCEGEPADVVEACRTFREMVRRRWIERLEIEIKALNKDRARLARMPS